MQGLVELRTAYANLLNCFENAIESSSKAKKKCVALLRNPLQGAVSSNCDFHSAFDILTDKEVSLFDIQYLKSISTKLPKKVR